MANNYWQGGWANSPMRALPGTQAAAMSGGNYGPWNALADMLGAYWQKKNQEGAMAKAQDFRNSLDEIAKPDWQKQEGQAYTVGDPVSADTLGKADFSFDNPQAAQVQQGENPFTAINRPAMVQYGYIPNKGLMTQGENGELQPTQGQQEAAQMAIAQNQQATAPERYMERNSQPMSYADYKQKGSDLAAQIKQEILRKYGPDAAARAIQYIDDAVNSRVGAYGDAALAREYDALMNGRGNINTVEGQRDFLIGAGRYNNLARQIGRDGISPSDIKAMIDAGRVNISNVNQGDSINLLAAPQAGQWDDGTYLKSVGSLTKNMSPSEQAQMSFREREAVRDQENRDRDYALKVENMQRQWAIEDRKMELAMQKAQAAGRLDPQRVQAAKAIIDDFRNWKSQVDNYDAPDTDYTNYEAYQQALSMLTGALGGAQAQPAQGGNIDSRVVDWIKENRGNASDDEILAEIARNGQDPEQYRQYLK